MIVRVLAVALILGGVWPSGVNAETVLIGQAKSQRNVSEPRPTRGMSMAGVEERFGQPVDKRDAVGDPPITRWEYETFIVYFEYQTVIHAVEKHAASS